MRVGVATAIAIALAATQPAAAAPWWSNPANWFKSATGPTTGGAYTSPPFVRSSDLPELRRWGQRMDDGVNTNDARRIETDAFYARDRPDRPDARISGFRAVLRDATDEDFAAVRVYDADTGELLGRQRFAYEGHAANGARHRVSIDFREVRGIRVQVVTGDGHGAKRNGNGLTIAKAHAVQVQNCAPTRAAAMRGEVRGSEGRSRGGRRR